MSDIVGFDPVAATWEPRATASLRSLWHRSANIEAVWANPEVLLELGDLEWASEAHPAVHLIASVPPARPLPLNWNVTLAHDLGSPQFLLFYPLDSSFPECGVILSGEDWASAWLTFHRRPLTLYRLRERFRRTLPRHPNSRLTLAAVRESPRTSPDDGLPALRRGLGDEVSFVTPIELYRRVLAVHFSGIETEREANRPSCAPALAVHQQRAYERACGILERYGGVIIADSVGLGKTYVGLRLVERALAAEGRVLVIVPAALKEQWRKELGYVPSTALDCTRPYETAAHDPRVRPDDNLDFWVMEPESQVSLLTMESLGRRGFDAARYDQFGWLLVDEAHNFRNPKTRRYRNLAYLASHAKVVLLTATPINNTLLDLQHLLDLFAAPSTFRHLGIPDYRWLFRPGAAADAQVRKIVSACVIRRTRRFLREGYGDVQIPDNALQSRHSTLRFPSRRPPIAVDYDLPGTYGRLFDRLEDWLEGLYFPTVDAQTSPGSVDDPAAGAAPLLKIILLKRIESSVEAFRRSITQQRAWCDCALRAIASGRLLTRPMYATSFRGPADDPASQLALFELLLPPPTVGGERIAAFRKKLEHDSRALTEIRRSLDQLTPRHDDKLQKLFQLLDGPLFGQKILIFTEFKDTARYLHRALRHRPHLAQIDSGGARLGSGPASRDDVIQRFAPLSSALPQPPHRERVDLLIATDVLSEGLNLQDASAVVSYDLPWNPVRLLQRVGRIDRLGNIHDAISTFHFVPLQALERLLGLMSRLQGKISTIEEALGLDHPLLAPTSTSRQELDQLRLLVTSPDGYAKVEADQEGPFDPEEQAYLDYVAALEEGESTDDGPACVAVAPNEALPQPRAIGYWRVAFGSQSRGLWLICNLGDGSVIEDQALALEGLRAAREALPIRPFAGSEPLARRARVAFAQYAEATLNRLRAGHTAGDALPPSLPQCRIAAWLGAALSSTPPSFGRQDRLRADGLLRRLAQRFTRQGEAVLAEIAGKLPERPDGAFLSSLEVAVADLTRNASQAVLKLEVGTLLLVNE